MDPYHRAQLFPVMHQLTRASLHSSIPQQQLRSLLVAVCCIRKGGKRVNESPMRGMSAHCSDPSVREARG
eukprot:6182195-Pleurochrysis_carterae.AAC.3